MTPETIGILHPGAMGVSVAASAKNTGHTVYWASDYWASEGRSPQTHKRAEQVGLVDKHSIAKICDECSVIVSVCPPHAAEDVAQEVIDHTFNGIYLDANAISPQRVTCIGLTNGLLGFLQSEWEPVIADSSLRCYDYEFHPGAFSRTILQPEIGILVTLHGFPISPSN